MTDNMSNAVYRKDLIVSKLLESTGIKYSVLDIPKRLTAEETWEILASAGFIPFSWVNHPDRMFVNRIVHVKESYPSVSVDNESGWSNKEDDKIYFCTVARCTAVTVRYQNGMERKKRFVIPAFYNDIQTLMEDRKRLTNEAVASLSTPELLLLPYPPTIKACLAMAVNPGQFLEFEERLKQTCGANAVAVRFISEPKDPEKISRYQVLNVPEMDLV